MRILPINKKQSNDWEVIEKEKAECSEDEAWNEYDENREVISKDHSKGLEELAL